jgi:hypothetical protein
MTLRSLLTNHTHYWGVPHVRAGDGRFIQICYECGSEREITIDLRPFTILPEARSIETAVALSLGETTYHLEVAG